MMSWRGTSGEEGELYTVNVDDPDRATWLVRGPGQERMSAWMPGGTAVVFVRFGVDENAGDLIMRDLETGVETNITNTPSRQEYFPSVSGDGEWLYYDEIVPDARGRWVYGRIVRERISDILENR